MTSLQCHRCGTLVNPGAIHCPACGAARSIADASSGVDPPGSIPSPLPLLAPPSMEWGHPPGPPSPYVRANFNWIGEAWRLIIADPVEYILYYFLMFLVVFFALLTPLIPFIPALIALERDELWGSALFMLLSAGMFCILLLLQPIVVLGTSKSELEKLRTGKSLAVGATLAWGFSRLGHGILLMLIFMLVNASLACLNMFCSCVAPVVLLAYYMLIAPIQLSYMRLADGAPDAWTALSESFAIVQRDWIGYTLLGIAVGMLASLGLLLCGVGVFITAPISYVTFALAYRANFDR